MCVYVAYRFAQYMCIVYIYTHTKIKDSMWGEYLLETRNGQTSDFSRSKIKHCHGSFPELFNPGGSIVDIGACAYSHIYHVSSFHGQGMSGT